MRCKITATDEELRAMYCVEGMRLREIADKYSCAVSAVSLRLKKAGVVCRKSSDYPASEKVRAAWVEIGKMSKGRCMSERGRKKISAANKGRRFRDDYEFGGHEKHRRDGYVRVYVPDHPNSSADGYVMKHTLVVERAIGRYLTQDEVVHHINHIRDDNRFENLWLMTKKEHMSMHMKERHANRRANIC